MQLPLQTPRPPWSQRVLPPAARRHPDTPAVRRRTHLELRTFRGHRQGGGGGLFLLMGCENCNLTTRKKIQRDLSSTASGTAPTRGSPSVPPPTCCWHSCPSSGKFSSAVFLHFCLQEMLLIKGYTIWGVQLFARF